MPVPYIEKSIRVGVGAGEREPLAVVVDGLPSTRFQGTVAKRIDPCTISQADVSPLRSEWTEELHHAVFQE